MKKIRHCDICGRSSLEKRVTHFQKYGLTLCSKHYSQLCRFGEIVDPTPDTTRDKNKIVLLEDHAELYVHNRISGEDERVLIDLDDVDMVSNYRWSLGIQPQRYNYKYVCGIIDGKIKKLHRFILNYDGDDTVDHINRNTLDNRKCNLRIVSATRNKQNVNPLGIYQRPNGRWGAAFQREKRQFYVGTFDTPEEAKLARNNAVSIFDLAHYGYNISSIEETK